jgi:hypothetical protein
MQDLYANATARARAAEARPVTDRLLVEMKNLVEGHGGRFCIIVFHLSPEALTHYLELMQKNRIDFVDCSYPITTEYRVRGDHHANGAMHTRYADTIVAKMRADGWIDP